MIMAIEFQKMDISFDDEITRNMDDEYFSSDGNREDDNLTNKIVAKEKEIRSAVDELAR